MNKMSKNIIVTSVLVVSIFTAYGFLNDAQAYDWSDSGSSCGSCGGEYGGYDGGSYDWSSPSPSDPAPTPQAQPAVCNYLTASLSGDGQSANISWSVSNATSITITKNGSSIGRVGTSVGYSTHPISGATTFVLTATGTGGNASCVASVTPPPPVQNPAVCNYLNASATSVKYGGDTVTLSWSVSNASSVSISGIGNVTGLTSTSVFVNSDTTFTLTAVGTGGNGSCAVTITVQPAQAAVCNYLNSSHVNVPVEGANVTLSWSTTNASSVSISGVGNVSPASGGQVNVFVSGNRTFTLTAVGTGGNGTCTVSIGTNVTNKDIPRCDYLRANVGSNVKRGDRITLSWGTTNADMVSISPDLGGVSRNGSETVVIEKDVTTYTLTARNFQTNHEATCTVTVRVDKADKAPTCDLKVSKSRVNRGEKVTLSWKTTDAEDIRIRDDQGKTIFDISHYSVSDRRHYKTGEVDVIVNRSTEFIMNVRGENNTSRTCRVDVTVGNLEVYEKRDQGYVIALTQVPYTGFEAGAFLTFLFYAVLTLWALFIAYVLVIKKGSVLGFSLYGATAGMSQTDLANRKKVEALVAKYSGQNQK